MSFESELLLKQSGKKYAHLRDKLLLDTGLTIEATIMNKEMITNVRNSNKPLVMATNAGIKKMTLDGDLRGIGTGLVHTQVTLLLYVLLHWPKLITLIKTHACYFCIHIYCTFCDNNASLMNVDLNNPMPNELGIYYMM